MVASICSAVQLRHPRRREAPPSEESRLNEQYWATRPPTEEKDNFRARNVIIGLVSDWRGMHGTHSGNRFSQLGFKCDPRGLLGKATA